MKSFIIAGLLLGASHGAAIAGPYLNVEANSGFSGNDYNSTVIENHVGYESGAWYAVSYTHLTLPTNREV